MRFVATDVFDYHRPSKCGLRVYLRAQGAAEAPPGPFEETLRRLGRLHEAQDLAALTATADVIDLARVDDRRERERETLRLLSEGAEAIYQGRLRALVEVDGEACEIVGEPDFLIRTAAGHRIRDSKLARRIEGPHHPEIRLQLQLYGFLYERLLGRPPAALEVHSGSGDLVTVAYDGGGAALGYLRFLRSLRAAATEPYEPVGWSKCGGCGFQERCWTRAEESRDVALILTVSQGLARELASRGTRTLGDLLSRFDESSLAAIEYRDGRGRRSVGGGSAREILRSARVLSTGKEEIFAPPGLPNPEDCVLFDVEGMPARFDELEKVYLWGLKSVGGDSPGYLPALAGFGPEGDREAWERFLRNASALLEERPTRRFVHWGGYERTKIGMYVARFGDAGGTAARVLERLVDLLAVMRRSIALPVPSYSLKVVEKHVGFRRTLPEANGEWAMARYIEATETNDPVERAGVLERIKVYNEEDLDSTLAILTWLRERVGAGVART
jgi:predicted RecB family nuclease